MSDYPLIVIQPLTITDAMIVALGTNVAETDYAAWSGATTYGLGDHVILASTHKIYQSLQAGNLNKDPTASTSALWWIEVSPTNKWKLFDTSNSTQTKQATYIKYTITPGQTINAIAALNLTGATSAVITVTSASAGVVYSKTIDLSPLPASPSWWDWFFGIKRVPRQSIQVDLPSYPDATIKFELYGGASLAIGVLLIGQQRVFGDGIKYGARVGIQSFSRKETNDFGDVVLVKRANAKRLNFVVTVDAGEVDALQYFLADVDAVPCLWIGSSQYEATGVFGFYKDFDILISYPTSSDCSIQIEGLT